MRCSAALVALGACVLAGCPSSPASTDAGTPIPDAGMSDGGTPDAGATTVAGDGGWQCPFPQPDGGFPAAGAIPDGGVVWVLLADGGVADGGDGSSAACAMPAYCFSGNPFTACVDPGRCVIDEGRYHLDPSVAEYPYVSQPPSSGPHNPTWATWGVSAVPIERVHYVHNEEHGGIVLVYNCPTGCPDVVQAFTDVYNATASDSWNEVKIVVTSDPEYDGGQWAAAAWDHVYTPPPGTPVDEPTLLCFVDTYIDRGPENAP